MPRYPLSRPPLRHRSRAVVLLGVLRIREDAAVVDCASAARWAAGEGGREEGGLLMLVGVSAGAGGGGAGV